MNSEKVKEIKKALEDNANYEHHNKLGYIDSYKCKTVAFADILTLISELETENERLKDDAKVKQGFIEDYKIVCDKKDKENAELKAENESLNKLFTYDKPVFDRCNNLIHDIKKQASKETAEKWHYHITTTLLALWNGNKITTEAYNSWIVFFNGLAEQFGVEIKE